MFKKLIEKHKGLSDEIKALSDSFDLGFEAGKRFEKLEPACPVCNGTPVFTLDRRVNEWDGLCKRCGVVGCAASTEEDAKRKWIEWHSKKIV